MNRQTALILLLLTLALYYVLVWQSGSAGPGAKILYTVVLGIVVLFLMQSIFPKKKKKRK